MSLTTYYVPDSVRQRDTGMTKTDTVPNYPMGKIITEYIITWLKAEDEGRDFRFLLLSALHLHIR